MPPRVSLYPGDNRQTLRRSTVEYYLGTTIPEELFEDINNNRWRDYPMLLDNISGAYFTYSPDSIVSTETDCPSLKIVFSTLDEAVNGGEDFVFSIPFSLLAAREVHNNWVYRITFFGNSNSGGVGEGFRAFGKERGYVGMTSRPHPLERFKEHLRNVRNDSGHTLHKGWAAILKATPCAPQFHLCGNFRTRDIALDVEEFLVDQHGTLVPHGLNMIPGGKKGIRELWKLGLLSRRDRATDRERDIALSEIEKGKVATHYRRGHTRKLPSGFAKSSTWVSSCWVGLAGGIQGNG